MTAKATSTPRRARVGDMAWMSQGGCVRLGDLPWTADPKHTTARERHLMGAVCQGCPVLKECADYAKQQKVTGGFWAGRHRDPNALSIVAGSEWTPEPLPGLGGLGGAA